VTIKVSMYLEIKISQTESYVTDKSVAVLLSYAYEILVSEPGMTRLHVNGSLRRRYTEAEY
jgi:hypothetical protein